MATPEFNAWNDFAHVVTLYGIDASTGLAAPLTGATCTAFMSSSVDTDAAKPEGAPSGTVTETTTPGNYTAKIEGDEFDPAVCGPMFGTSKLGYLHVRNDKNVRIAIPCKYVRDRVVKVTT